jgi:hypothetical protein
VLTGAIVGLGLAATISIRGGVASLGFDIETSLTDAQVADLGALGMPSINNFGGACGGTPEFPVMDCGVVWTFGIAGTVVGADGQTYNVNDQNVLVDDRGNPLPISMSLGIDENGNFVRGDSFDAAGRRVDGNGVPI